MKVIKLIIGILILSVIACKESKQHRQETTQVPEVDFNFPVMKKNKGGNLIFI